MDYVVGSIAALISGNVTPNRPRLIKRALTPTKHQSSPNVTPKSELVEDRSIFLSPTLQKKKAIVKKSPKRIFQNPDLDATGSNDDDASVISPKAEKVKKHLREELDTDGNSKIICDSLKVPITMHNVSTDSILPMKKLKIIEANDDLRANNENTPKKKKKRGSEVNTIGTEVYKVDTIVFKDKLSESNSKSPKKSKQKHKPFVADADNMDIDDKNPNSEISENNLTNDTGSLKENENIVIGHKHQQKSSKKKNKKNKNKPKTSVSEDNDIPQDDKSDKVVNKGKERDQNIEGLQDDTPKKIKNKFKNNSKILIKTAALAQTDEKSESQDEEETTNTANKNKNKPLINPNAITQEDSDSEHESDNEIESENEEVNKKMLERDPVDESSEEEEEVEKKPEKLVEKVKENSEEEVKRTIFVGNVPFSNKCKKEIKKIFNKYGRIETIRIRTVPVKEAHVTPKLAVIKNELHPERSTVNVYVKFSDLDSVEQALIENNTILNNHHLRVTRSATTGAEHDPRSSIFVGNLPFALEDEAFREKFEKCGEIESVRIIRDKKTNAGKGFGYINFKSKDGVELALALTEEDLTIKNRILRVKRCTQTTHKKGQGRDQTNQRRHFIGQNDKNQGHQQGRNFGGSHKNNQGRSQGKNFRERNENNMGRTFGGQIRNNPERNQGRNFGGRTDNNMRKNFGGQNRNNSERNQGRYFGGQNEKSPGRYQGKSFGGRNESNENQGAFRRIMNKRKPEEGNSEGPPNKRQKNITQPREKKPRKEFVGITAEKKKKHKFDKGQKKKKALSEILTK